MAYSAFPIISEAFVYIRDLKTGVYIVAGYLFFMDFVFYGIFNSAYGCGLGKGFFPLYRFISTVLAMAAGIAVLLGTFHKNWRFLRNAVIMGMVCFGLDAFGGFMYLKHVVNNLGKTCTFNAWVMATIGIMLPLVLLYMIIIVHSYRVEMQFILRKPKDQELHVNYY